MESRIRDVLKRKDSAVFTVSSDAMVGEAVESMVAHGVGSVVVLDGRRVVGVLSERDVVIEVACAGRDPWLTRVGDLVVGRPLVVARPDQTVPEVMTLMTERRTRHVPICEDEQLRGIVSIGDLTKWVTRDLHRSLSEMHSYVAGPYAA